MSNHMQNGTKGQNIAGRSIKSGFVFYIEYVLLNKYDEVVGRFLAGCIIFFSMIFLDISLSFLFIL